MKTLASLSIAIAMLFFVSFDLPNGWGKAGSNPKSYDMGIDKGAGRNGGNAATIKSIKTVKGFGTLMQDIKPDAFLGKRIRLTGYVKTNDVKWWSGMWLRVDKKGSDLPLSFDNMQDRGLSGTADWKKCEIVLYVPEEASNIAFGVLLSGKGQVWFDDFSFEVVSNDVPLTGDSKPRHKPNEQPANLNFEN